MSYATDCAAAALLVTAILLSSSGTTTEQAKYTPLAHADESPFLADNATAMDKMMAGMKIKPSGDIDADFSAMMVPHHQGAIEMAIAELRYGANEKLRRIAQEIIIDQQQEIAAMRLALGQPLAASVPAPTQFSPSDLCTERDGLLDHQIPRHSGMGDARSMSEAASIRSETTQ